jgi:hypothetical protein
MLFDERNEVIIDDNIRPIRLQDLQEIRIIPKEILVEKEASMQQSHSPGEEQQSSQIMSEGQV